MNLPIAEAVARLEASADYRERFAAAYDGKISPRTIGRALAAFQKTLDSFDTAYDRYNLGDDAAISESAKRGGWCSSARASAPIVIPVGTSLPSDLEPSGSSTAAS